MPSEVALTPRAAMEETRFPKGPWGSLGVPLLFLPPSPSRRVPWGPGRRTRACPVLLAQVLCAWRSFSRKVYQGTN